MGRALATVILILVALLGFQPVQSSGPGVSLRSCTVHIVAVSSSGGGVVGNLTVTIAYPGAGRVYISTSPASMVDTQGSARLAAFAASLLAGVDMSRLDFYYDLESGSIIVGGPSAGAAMALATLALLEGEECPSWVVATGMIQPDTSIGPVGGLKEKLEAAASAGAKLFIIPAGQEVYTYYETVERRAGPFVYIERRPVTVNLTSLGEELGVEVYAAPTLASAYEKVYGVNLAGGGGALEVPGWVKREIAGFINYTASAVAGIPESGLPPVSRLAGEANESLSEAKGLYGSGAYYQAALKAVDALTAAREAEIIYWAAHHDLDVTRYVESVNETLLRLWGEAVNASSGALGLQQVESLAYAFAKLSIAAKYYQDALSSLEESEGSYRLPASLLGVDLTGAELLANAWSMAEWAWFWLNASMHAPVDPQVDRHSLEDAARLLKAQAKTTAAYLDTLLEEAGGNAAAARLPEYLAERAAAEDNPVAVIGLAVESISASTAAIHREFTLRTAATARGLEELAARLASEAPGGLQSSLLLNLASTTNDAQTALAAASKAVLYSWLEAQLTGKTSTPAWITATAAPTTTTAGPGTSSTTVNTTETTETPSPSQGGSSPAPAKPKTLGAAATLAAASGAAGFILGALAVEALRGRGR